jgi:hypothetical protein
MSATETPAVPLPSPAAPEGIGPWTLDALPRDQTSNWYRCAQDNYVVARIGPRADGFYWVARRHGTQTLGKRLRCASAEEGKRLADAALRAFGYTLDLTPVTEPVTTTSKPGAPPMSTSTTPTAVGVPKSVLIVGGIRKHIDTKITPGLRARGLDVKWLWETTQAPGTIPADCEIVLVAADVATKPQQDAARFQAKARNLPLVNVTAYKWDTTAAALTRAGFTEPVAEVEPAKTEPKATEAGGAAVGKIQTDGSISWKAAEAVPESVKAKATPAPPTPAPKVVPPAPVAPVKPPPSKAAPTSLSELFAAYRPLASEHGNSGTFNVYDSYTRFLERTYGNLPLKACAELDARIYDDAESGKLDRFKKEHHWTGKAFALAREKGWLPTVKADAPSDVTHRDVKAAVSLSRTLPDGRGRFAWTFRPPLGRGKNGGKKTQTSTAIRLKADEVTTYIDLHLDAATPKKKVISDAEGVEAKAALVDAAAARKANGLKGAQARWGKEKDPEVVPAKILVAKVPPPLTVSPPAAVVIAATSEPTPVPVVVQTVPTKVSGMEALRRLQEPLAAPSPAPANASVERDPKDPDWMTSKFVSAFRALRTSMAALGIPEMTVTAWADGWEQPTKAPVDGLARDIYNLQVEMTTSDVRSATLRKDGILFERVVVVKGFEPL